MSSKFLQSCVVATFKLSNSGHKYKSSFVLHCESRTHIAAEALVCFFLLLLEFAVRIQKSVWPLQTSDVFVANEEQRRAKPTGRHHAVFRNSLSAERFCSLFVDCRYRFVLKKKKINKKAVCENEPCSTLQ